MTELIEQRTSDQCAIATIAMATGEAYETVLEIATKLGHYEPGKGTYGLCHILDELGLCDETEYQMYRLDHCITPVYFRRQLWGRRAMVQSPSLNIEGGQHIVYWTGQEVLDPNPTTKKRYTKFEELMPVNIWVFNEV